jgi:hypothetical protein
MIKKLTPEQETLRDEWRERWFQIGCSCAPADRPMAEQAITEAYATIKRKKPEFVWAQSPLDAYKIYSKDLGKKELISTPHWGQMDAYWVALYRFCEEVLGVKYEPSAKARLDIQSRIVQSCGWIYPWSKVCIVVERLASCHWKGPPTQRVLHKDGAMAASYRDGWGIYRLNGVAVPKWLAVTPDSQLDPAKVATIDNAEVRREFVRKVGIERIAQKLNAKTLNKAAFKNESGTHSYELLALDAGGAQPWKFLKMENPSLPGTYHLEGVPNELQTVKEALCFRNGLSANQVDEENGAEWLQQGDVILRPKGAKKFKLFPKALW